MSSESSVPRQLHLLSFEGPDLYVARANEIELARWRRRGLGHKLKDNAFYLLNELL